MVRHWNRLPREIGGVTVHGGVQKSGRYGTSGHGLADMVVLDWQLDLTILEVFSNLNDSVVLYTCGEKTSL